MTVRELKVFLDEKYLLYHSKDFIESDPIQIPHLFHKKQDIEISGFLTATIAWGQRKSIIKNAKELMNRFDQAPYDFVMNHNVKDLQSLDGFVHRTYNSLDLQFFIKSLKNLYQREASLENYFLPLAEEKDLQMAIYRFRNAFFDLEHLRRTEKHVSNPLRNSACKRINMFLRWMVRTNSGGVDFEIWKNIPSSHLSCPLDVHSGNVARKLGLLKRKQNDGKALLELDGSLRIFDPIDPVKYDFALFGLGVFEKF